MSRLFCAAMLWFVLAFAAQARCTNYNSLAKFDLRKHTIDNLDFYEKGYGRFVVETEAGLLPVYVSVSIKNAVGTYFRDGTGAPVWMSVSVSANACKKGSTRLFTPKYYKKYPMDPPFPFDAPLASPASAPTVEALARTILSATFCRGGEIALNHSFTYIDQRGIEPKRKSAPALHLLGPGYGDSVWNVHFTCSLWRER